MDCNPCHRKDGAEATPDNFPYGSAVSDVKALCAYNFNESIGTGGGMGAEENGRHYGVRVTDAFRAPIILI